MRSKGLHFEKLALDYLKKKGLKPVHSNYTCKVGEIDLVMYDRDTLVFVEVRFRRGSSHGTALESITPTKRERITRSAKLFLGQHDLWQKNSRFDVIAISENNLSKPTITWIKSAFYASE